MARKKHIITHKPAGYQGYLDQKPINQPNVKAIAMIVASIFACGVISAVSLVFVLNMMRPAPETSAAVVKEQPAITEDISPVFVADVSSPQPTYTPEATASPAATITPEATPSPLNDLQLTVDFMATNIALIGSQTPETYTTEIVITATPAATATQVYLGWAVVVYNNVIIRSGSSRNTRDLSMAFDGERYGILDTRPGWVRIDHPTYDPAWIADHLVRTEAIE